MYLETMERVLGGTDKIILDTKGGQGSCRSCRSINCRKSAKGLKAPNEGVDPNKLQQFCCLT